VSAKHLTPAIIARTLHVIDTSGVLDLVCPPRLPGQTGRRSPPAAQAHAARVLRQPTLSLRRVGSWTLRRIHMILLSYKEPVEKSGDTPWVA